MSKDQKKEDAEAFEEKFRADFKKFLTRATSPFNSVYECSNILKEEGQFKEIDLELFFRYRFKRGDKIVVTQNGSSIYSFAIGSKFGFKGRCLFAAGHTDSPVLRIRPENNVTKSGHLMIGCSTYGGGLWHTWFDRELSAAGRVMVAKGEDIVEYIVDLREPVCVVPNLAIHLQSAEDRKAFKVDTEEHLVPLIAMQLNGEETDSKCSLLIQKIADSLNRDYFKYQPVIKPEKILDLDMSLYDFNRPRFAGMNEEFIMSGRLDNQLSTFCIMKAMVQPTLSDKDITWGVAFDHEECGSESHTGAQSALLKRLVEHVVNNVEDDGWNKADQYSMNQTTSTIQVTPVKSNTVLAKSLLLSVDGAHALHPNHAAIHQKEHQTKMGGGVVLKTNENQRYTTDAYTRSIVKLICKDKDIKFQDFVVKNTSPCGSTIGPICSTLLGIRSIDLGAPQLAMHSIRETAHMSDVLELYKLICAVFSNYSKTEVYPNPETIRYNYQF